MPVNFAVDTRYNGSWNAELFPQFLLYRMRTVILIHVHSVFLSNMDEGIVGVYGGCFDQVVAEESLGFDLENWTWCSEGWRSTDLG